MPKQARPESTGGKQVTGRELTQFKPGQSGNPKGRPKGSRNKLSEDFFRDLCDSWQTMGKAALLAAAWTNPTDFVRIVANLMPREMETTATNVELERMSDQQLNALIAEWHETRRAHRVDPDPMERG